jgi:hypothetical protein
MKACATETGADAMDFAQIKVSSGSRIKRKKNIIELLIEKRQWGKTINKCNKHKNN